MVYTIWKNISWTQNISVFKWILPLWTQRIVLLAYKNHCIKYQPTHLAFQLLTSMKPPFCFFPLACGFSFRLFFLGVHSRWSYEAKVNSAKKWGLTSKNAEQFMVLEYICLCLVIHIEGCFQFNERTSPATPSSDKENQWYEENCLRNCRQTSTRFERVRFMVVQNSGLCSIWRMRNWV